MTTEDQINAWAVLPPEYRAKVREYYQATQLSGTYPARVIERAEHRAELLRELFGTLNLVGSPDASDLVTHQSDYGYTPVFDF